jgi:hypothetical protein
MILKAKERGGGRALGLYLLKTDTNEHVEVHELRGFVSSDLPSALQEVDAISRGTKAKNAFFSLSLNPPPNERVSADAFEVAADAVERKLGLERQPRAIVFHEVEGRRHAHAVWSRIDAQKMKAINLSFYKTKLRDVSRELFLEHGWRMPRGLMNSRERDPSNFTLSEWQQTKRSGHDPKALKEMFRECWASSDSKRAFAAALQARGYTLARGDRRGYVAVDFRGEVYAIARYAGVKTKDVRSRLGDGNDLPSVEQAKSATAERMTTMLRRRVQEVEAHAHIQAAALASKRDQIIQKQRAERKQIEEMQHARWTKEHTARAERFSRGVRGVWDRLTGRHVELRRQNEKEALQALRRDRAEKDNLIFAHIEQRRALHQHTRQMRQQVALRLAELHRDIGAFTRPALSHTRRQHSGPERER